MTAVLVLAIVILVIGAVSGATMSAFRKEKKSIDSHKRMLGLMEELSGSEGTTNSSLNPVEPQDRAKTHVRAIRPTAAPSLFAEPEPPTISMPPVVRLPEGGAPISENGTIAANHSEQEGFLESEDNPTVPLPRVSFDTLMALGTASKSRPSRAPLAPRHRTAGGQSRIASVVILVAVGVGVTTAAVLGASKSHPDTSGSLPVAKPKSKSIPKKTQAPVVAQLTAISSDAYGASYSVPTGLVTVVLHAASPCWVEESTSPYGRISWDATLSANQTYTITSAAPLWLRTGNVGALSITVNGKPVVFAAAPGPYNFTFTGGA